MRIKAILPSYRQVEKEIDERRTIADLKRNLCSELGIEIELTRLLLNGNPISERSRVSRLKETDGQIVVDYLWARHLILWSIKGQGKIRSASVLLAGAASSSC